MGCARVSASKQSALLAKPRAFTVRAIFSYQTVAHLRKKPIPRVLNVVK
jgi:hypothetical protein